MTKLNAILAMNHRGVIGRNNRIPWYIPEDLQYFKKITQNHIVIMGRKTFESLPNGPLTNRINVVLTNHPNKYNHIEKEFRDQLYFVTFENLEKILQEIQKNETKEIFIIGGSQIYKKFFPLYTKIYLTIVDDSCTDPEDTYNIFMEESILKHNYMEIYRETMKTSRINDQKYQHIIFEKNENDKEYIQNTKIYV